MPTLAGWLTGEQVSQDIIAQTLAEMGNALNRGGTTPVRTVQAGAGFLSFADSRHAMKKNDDPPVLDWVPERRTLVYRRPLSGQHPLYYIQDWPAEGNLLFASEIKALLAVGAPRRLHLAALDSLLRYGFIPAPWTAFQDIYIVPAGSILRWQHTKLVVNQSTDYRLEQLAATEHNLEQIGEQLNTVIGNQLPPESEIVSCADGQYASALSAGIANRHGITQTIATLNYSKNERNERWRYAQQIAQACQAPFLAITAMDHPDYWIAALSATEAPTRDTRAVSWHQLLHTVLNETGTRVAFNGLGASTILGQHSPHQTIQAEQTLLDAYSRGNTPASLWHPETLQALQAAERWEDTLYARKLLRLAEQQATPAKKLLYLDLHLRLPDYDILPIIQLAAQEEMALRSAYLHPSVYELLLPLAGTEQSNTILQALTQRALPALAGEPKKPPMIIKTKMFQQIESSELLQHLLSDEALHTTGLFNPARVRQLLHKGHNEATLQELLFVFTTQLFCQLFQVTRGN